MLNGTTAAVLLALTLAAAAPPAHADHHTATCTFRSVQQEDVTGQNYEGVAFGVVAAGADDEVAVTCVVRVNGTPESATPRGAGTGVAYTTGRVTFAAGDTDVVTFCTVVTVDGATTETCQPTTVIQVPPQEVDDLVDTLPYDYPEPWFPCHVFRSVTGTYGPLVINEQGDVYLAGEPQFDCPPYDIWPPD